MDVIIQPDEKSAAAIVAAVIARELRGNPRLVLGLATGKTMEVLYRALVALHREEGLDFSECRTFNLDEYAGIGPDDPNSYHNYMHHHLFRHVNINRRNAHVPDGLAPDMDAECERYEGLIREAGGIDLQILGIGWSGHIGFNEPLSAIRSRTRVQVLAPMTLEQNGKHFGGADKMPRRAITMGVGTILESRRCILLAAGASKAEVVAKAIEGPITSMISATALQFHPRCSVVLDEGAAGQLQQKAYYRWMSAHQPEWLEADDTLHVPET